MGSFLCVTGIGDNVWVVEGLDKSLPYGEDNLHIDFTPHKDFITLREELKV